MRREGLPETLHSQVLDMPCGVSLARDRIPRLERWSMNIFSKFTKAYRVYSSETYRETMASLEKTAGASYRLLASKSDGERAKLLERTSELSKKLHDAIDHEAPLVVALTLLVALRTLEQTLQPSCSELK
jgi:hypothetical protein